MNFEANNCNKNKPVGGNGGLGKAKFFQIHIFQTFYRNNII